MARRKWTIEQRRAQSRRTKERLAQINVETTDKPAPQGWNYTYSEPEHPDTLQARLDRARLDLKYCLDMLHRQLIELGPDKATSSEGA